MTGNINNLLQDAARCCITCCKIHLFSKLLKQLHFAIVAAFSFQHRYFFAFTINNVGNKQNNCQRGLIYILLITGLPAEGDYSSQYGRQIEMSSGEFFFISYTPVPMYLMRGLLFRGVGGATLDLWTKWPGEMSQILTLQINAKRCTSSTTSSVIQTSQRRYDTKLISLN